MKKSILILGAVVLAVATGCLAASAFAAQPIRAAAVNVQARPRHATISVLTYTVGGPHRVGTQLISNAMVRLRRSSNKALVREVKGTHDGHVAFSITPGSYQVEAALEPPDVTPTRRCGPPKAVHVGKGRRALVRLYCSIP
jgi:hypothetical protein